MTTYYKYLNDSNTGGYSSYQWPVDRLGEWLPEIAGPLAMCENGYHVLTESQLVGSFMLNNLYEVEVDGETLDSDDKVCARKARLIRRVDAINTRALVLFAADCAEHVLHHFESKCPRDKRPRQAIEAARGGNPGAAYAAADAAYAAARAAARAADAAYAAYAAHAADAAYAAHAAAYGNGYDQIKAWQLNRFKEYMAGTVDLSFTVKESV